MQLQNVKLGTNMSAAHGRVASALSLVCCVLFLACAAPPGIRQPFRTQPAPPPTTSHADTLARSEDAGPVAVEPLRPRVLVIIKLIPKDDIMAVTDGMLEPETLESLIADAFRSRGYPVVDYAKAREHIKKDQLRRILEGDDRTAADVGLDAEADLVVAGSVQESKERRAASNAAETTDVVNIRIAARAVNTATGEVQGTALVELDAQSDLDAARQRAADSVAAELSAPMLENWQARTIITEIYADDADEQRVELLKSTIMNEVVGVDSVVTRSLAGRSAVVEVFSRISSDELLARVDRCTTAIPFAVRSFSGNRIDILFLDQPEECKPGLK